MPKLPLNPFKPGAGHSPPHLAGRKKEADEFRDYLAQDQVIQNLVLTGLRGVGKTVLMDDVYKQMALSEGWIWVGSDFSEAAFVDEQTLCYRLFTDLSLFTSTLTVANPASVFGFNQSRTEPIRMDFHFLVSFFNAQPGLNADKLKATLELAWQSMQATGRKGVLFAYDQAQVVQDRKEKGQYPLALLLETFQSLQKRGIRYMLLLTGLPTLFPRLVESRTYAERMFSVQEIGRLDPQACKEAIEKPLERNPINFSEASVKAIILVSSCYPYFIQFICREAYDFFKAHIDSDQAPPAIPMESLVRKLDADFFAGRWSKVPDRQRELLLCIACLSNAGDEFTVNQIVEISRGAAKKYDVKPFKANDVSAMIPKLISVGLVYKNRHGRYLLAVPLFDAFIRRQFEKPPEPFSLFDGIPE